MKERNSRISGFYKRSREERIEALRDNGFLSKETATALLEGHADLQYETANNMIENAIGVLGLPLGIGLHFNIDGRDYAVPMAIEEPSVLAAVSNIAKLVRQNGSGFDTDATEPIMIGQIQVLGAAPDSTKRILAKKEELLKAANACDPRLVECGGGAVDLEIRQIDKGDYRSMTIVHLLVDCRDAMGANLINTMVETLAPEIEAITGGEVYLRILSNFADQRVVTAECLIPVSALATETFDGHEVAQRIQIASEFAEVDPYRAATHNKGIMNGVSAVCIATGNDWRAIEAGAHAFASRFDTYGPLATWRHQGENLYGFLAMPMAVGIVGGTLRVHPTVQASLEILGVESASELARVMAAVGLAQNLGALKALATEGIQRGHMSLHARSVALAAGAKPDELEEVVSSLIERSEINVDSATEILGSMRDS